MKEFSVKSFTRIFSLVSLCVMLMCIVTACESAEDPGSGTPEPTGISLFPPTLTLDIGDTETLIATVTPSNADKNVNWRSDNPAVVKVESDGKITAMDEGTATVYALTVVGGKQASSIVTVNPPLRDIAPVNKYEMKDDPSNNINDKIKYSVSYGDIDYYYIYLGEMQHIPLFFYAAYNHEGMASSYSVSRTATTKETIETTVAESSQTTVSVSENYSTSSTNGGKVSAEISEKYTVSAKLSGKVFGVGGEVSSVSEVAGKVASENYWSTVNTTGGGINNQNSKSLTNTVKNGTETTLSTQETRTWNFAKSEKTGWYRYTLFSASDVYLYVVRNRTKPNEIYYEFREHVIPDVYFWKLDYSDKASFTKDDETRFNFNVSMLDNLPKAKDDVTPWTVSFDANGGSGTVPSPVEDVIKYSSITLPNQGGLVRDQFYFIGWSTDITGAGTIYSAGSSYTPTSDITLYAMWVRTTLSEEINNASFSIHDNVHLWAINTSEFDIPKLRSAGYKNFIISLEYKAEQTFLFAINARLWVDLRNSSGTEYNSDVVIPDYNKVVSYSLSSTVSLDNFDSLTVSWAAGTGGTVRISNRKVTITAVK
jgi:hypothetical protein